MVQDGAPTTVAKAGSHTSKMERNSKAYEKRSFRVLGLILQGENAWKEVVILIFQHTIDRT